MGIGAALIMPSTLSLLQSSFPRRERARAFAVWAAVAGAAGGVGPLMGGVLVEHFWYGSVFFVAALTPRWHSSPPPSSPRRRSQWHRLDRSALLSIVGFAALLAAIIEGPERGWTTPYVIAGFVLAAVGLVGFVLYACRRADARHGVLPQPPVRDGQHGHHGDVLRDVLDVLHPHPVPAVRAGVLVA
jgi:MFS family permease